MDIHAHLWGEPQTPDYKKEVEQLEKIYAAFAKNAKSMESLRNNTVKYVPGILKITKAIILSPEDYDKLAEDISPEYPFLKDNHDFMKVTPGGWFHALLVMTEAGREGMLLAQGPDGLYTGRCKDVRSLDLQGISVVRMVLKEPKAYQEHAKFLHKAGGLLDLLEWNTERQAAERETSFRVEKIIELTDSQYAEFRENGLNKDQEFMAEDNKLGWFDPSELCWHCLLVKGENSKDGILVDMEGYHYARYAAFVPDCGRLRLQDVPCRCTGEQRQAREARKQAHANRGEHFASFEGYMLPGTNYTLHFLKYDKGQDLFTVRRQGGPNQFVDFTGSPETVAREFYFREGLLKKFMDMDYRNSIHNSFYYTRNSDENKQKGTLKDKTNEMER